MNPDQLDKFFKEAKNIKLDEKKKNSISREILLFMKKHPLKPKIAKNNWFAIFASSNVFQLKTVRILMASFMMFLAVGLVGGIASVKADSSIPGDFLYPIKIGFNEKIIEALALSDKEKINVSLKLMERRLQETEKLIVANKINDSNATDLNNTFKVQADKALERISKLNEKKLYNSAMEFSSNFEASLRAHDRVLKNLKSDKPKENLDQLLKDIAKKVKDISDMKVLTKDNIIGKDALKNEYETQYRLKSAEDNIRDVRKIIKIKKNKLGQKAVLQLENNLNIAESKINEGKVNNELKSYREAFSNFEDAKNVIKETKHLLEAKNDLKVDFDIEINEDDFSDLKTDEHGSIDLEVNEVDF